MNRTFLAVVTSLGISACATSSGVMEAADGTYIISARAAPARGGTAGANAYAYEQAQEFCKRKETRAVVVENQERDVYQSSVGGSWNRSGGSIGGGTFAAGNATLRFICK